MRQDKVSRRVAVGLLVLLAALFAPGLNGWQPALAAATPISTQPIFVTPPSSAVVKPNIMLVLDDSGSMAWNYMPDDVSKFQGRYGFASSQCNGVYYNPGTTYYVPVDAAGNNYASSSFTAAPNDGYGLTTGSVDLSANFKAYGGDTAQAAYYYAYSGSQTQEYQRQFYNTGSTFYKECSSSIGSSPGSGVFTKVVVSATSGPGGTDERTNFANWYTYYRTRMNMMKTATGLAFKALSDQYRVGFMTINNNASPAFLNISDFNATQKTNFYSKLYASIPNSSTPLREALANVGRIYAGKLTTINNSTVVDPVQYSCQQNYTILSTDGFWNGTDSNVKKIDGTTTMDNQDGYLPRPWNDGAATTTTIVTPYTSTQDYPTITTTTRTIPWSQTTTVLGGACSTAAPPGAQSAPMSVSSNRTGGLGLASSNPNSNRCVSVGGTGSSTAWFCRSGSGGLPSGMTNSSVTDSTGTTWYTASVSGNTGCVTAATAFGSGYYSSVGVCPGQAGQTVTQTPYAQNETIVSTTTSLDHYTASQTTTQTIVNGVPGTVGPLSPTTPTYSLASNLSSSTTTSDTCGGAAAPCPSSTGTWTAGTTTSSCVRTAALPAAGTSTPTAGTATTSTNTSTGAVVASSGPTAGTPTITNTTTGGTSNTLADSAAYYYYTNLRTTTLGNCTPATALNNLCVGGPPATQDDPATWQHMTTFTFGLGTRGRMVYSYTYPQDAVNKVPGDYTDVRYGNLATSTTTCTWRDTLTVAGGPCNWPVPGADQIENVDDLWHAAVNGHGKYFAASSPGMLATGLKDTLQYIVNQPKPGTAASAATTNPKVSQSNAYQFSSFFLSVQWWGDLIRQTKDLTTGKPPVFDLLVRDPATYDWSARDVLDTQTYTNRAIYFNTGALKLINGTATLSSYALSSGTDSLSSFNWSSLGAASLQSYFTAPNITTSPPAYPNLLAGLTQFCATGVTCLTSTAQTNTTVATGGAAGEALVNFLRGDRSNEDVTKIDPTKFYRYRNHVLGDIVSAQPQYSGPPTYPYPDAGYADYKTLYANRRPLVFAAANDGMLHAFDVNTGAEIWAYIPSFEIPRLYTLADKSYSTQHQYFVEGTPVVGEICPSAPGTNCTGSTWKTIVVGGLNGGGRGYYALDITNADSPQLLWEFTDANLGYTFGNPQITKLDDGTWAVMVTSGYDNCPKGAVGSATADCSINGGGDGKGYLYVLNAGTGALIAKISTGAGSTTTPSGLGKIIAHENASTHITNYVYGGDLNGNLWRFTVSATAANNSAWKLATLLDANNVVQPIMDRPQVTTINGVPVVYVGTGRYLATSDVGVTPVPQESFYAIKDPLAAGNTYYNSPRASSNFLLMTAIDTTCPQGTDPSICNPGDAVRTVQQVAGSATDSLVNKSGWILDFPTGAGELEFTDPKLVLGTIAFTTSIPALPSTTDVCQVGATPNQGTSFLYMLDFLTGHAVGGSNGVAGSSLGQGIATSPQLSQLQDGSVIITTRMSGGNDVYTKGRFNSQNATAKRISWRELVSE